MVVFSLICEAYRTKEKKRKWVVFGKAWERHTPTEERLGPWMSGHPCETPWEALCRTPWETETFAGSLCPVGKRQLLSFWRKKKPYGNWRSPVKSVVVNRPGGK